MLLSVIRRVSSYVLLAIALSASTAFAQSRRDQAQTGIRPASAVAHLPAVPFASATADSADPQQAKPSMKIPVVAWVLSFAFPGAGQFYNHQIGKAIPMVIMGVVGLVFIEGGALWLDGCSSDYYGCDTDTETGAAIVSLVGVGVFLGGWIWSQVDAPIQAAKINRANGYASGLHVDPKLVRLPVNTAAAGDSKTAARGRRVGVNLLSYSF